MSLTFYSIGDWGEEGEILNNVAESMNNYSNQYPPKFVLALGDNFYPYGVVDIDDNLWFTTYKNIFTSPNLDCKWFPVLGNHDYLGNAFTQLEYFYKFKDTRWTMPSKYYTYSFKNKKDITIQIIAIDTILLAIETSNLFIPNYLLNFNDVSIIAKQIHFEWLINTLKESTADWLIIFGHYNLYSGSSHQNNYEMINLLKALFIEYNIDLYICGHCHCFEHIVDENIHYIVSGSGSKSDNVSNLDNTLFCSSSNGFTKYHIKNNKMFIDFIDSNSNVIYQTVINKKRNINP